MQVSNMLECGYSFLFSIRLQYFHEIQAGTEPILRVPVSTNEFLIFIMQEIFKSVIKFNKRSS